MTDQPTTALDLAALLDDVDRMVSRYVAFPHRHHTVVVVLWIAHTWVVQSFYVTPRLILDSAEPGSGKTRVLELLALLCRSAKLTLSTTTAALYRRIAAAEDAGDQPPTVLQDEADAIFGKNSTPQAEDLRALFNAGYKRGATVDRCEGDAKNMRVKEFPVWSPLALAGLAGRMPDTITSRGVTLHMRRRRPDQTLADFRERDAQAEAAPMRERLDAWAQSAHATLATARPSMPTGVTDRSAEIWEPLLAIADLAGQEWPMAARTACSFFVVDSAAAEEKLSLGQRLLRDIKELLDAEGATAMWSADIIRGLTTDLESEWRDLWGKALDQRRLAKELKRYDVKSKDIRQGIAKNKGYTIDGPNGLQQAWDHWLVPSLSATSATSATEQVSASRTVADLQHTATNATHPRHVNMPSELQKSEDVADVADVADTDGNPRGQGGGLCPECTRAPSRSDSGLCDFCTAKRRRQQTAAVRQKESCAQWLDRYAAELRGQGRTTVTTDEVFPAGESQGYHRGVIASAREKVGLPVIARGGSGPSVWSLTPDADPYVPASEWVHSYLDQLPAGTEVVDRDHFKAAVEAADYSWPRARAALTGSGRIETVPPPSGSKSRRDGIWRIRAEEAS